MDSNRQKFVFLLRSNLISVLRGGPRGKICDITNVLGDSAGPLFDFDQCEHMHWEAWADLNTV